MTRSLQRLALAQAEKRPHAIAIAGDGDQLTYADLVSRSLAIAAALRAVGCKEGSRVCLFLPKSPMAIAAMLGVLSAGCVYVPLDVQSPAARVGRIVARCDPAAFLVHGSAAGLLGAVLEALPGGAAIPIGWLDDEPPADARFTPTFRLAEVLAGPGGGALPASKPSDPAHILFTSGSTGEPKGVVVTHESVLRFVEWATRHFGMKAGDRVSGCSPLHFDLSTFDVYGALAVGAELHLVPPDLSILPHRLAAFIRERRLTQWFSVPAALGYLARFDAVLERDFPHLERVLWCGEVLPTPVLIHWMSRLPHVRFTNLYGPTETTIASSYHDVLACPADERAVIPIGRPCDGESLHVLDSNLEPVPPGEVGDLYIGGVGLSPGYFRDPVRTGEAFFLHGKGDGPRQRIYRTGDLAKVRDDGLVYFVGRADSQIKHRGHRVELGEIESAVHTIKGVAEHAVVAAGTGSFEGAVICCAFVPAPGSGVTALTVRAELQRLLPPYMLPSRWLALGALPRNANGKIDRPALVARFEEYAAATS